MAAPKGNAFWKLRTKHGRDKIFETPEIFWDACCEYFEATDARKWVKKDWVGKDAFEVNRETEVPYTISGLCLFLDIVKSTWDEYKTKEGFSAVASRVELIMFTQKFEGATVGAFNPSIIARDLQLADKQENNTTLNISNLPEALQAIAAKINNNAASQSERMD